jgi:hypothetical protein
MTDTGSYEATMAGANINHAGPEAAPRSTRRPLMDMPAPEVTTLVDQWFRRVTENRKHIERAALLGTAFLLDQQYVDFLGTHGGSKLIQQAHKRGRVRTVEQIIEPAYRGEMARLLRNRPVGVTIPDGDDPEDFESAEAGDKLLEHVYRTYKKEGTTEQAVSWQIVAGTSLEGVSWDPAALDPDGEQGAFVFRALSPFEFGVPHVRKESLQEQPYIMVTKAYELDEIEDRWSRRVRPDKAGSYGSLDDRLSAIISGGSTSGKQEHTESAIVKEVWVKPQPIAPEGLVIITSGETILDAQPFPGWARSTYPFAKYIYIPIPGSFWGKSLLQALIPLQRRHNRAASIIIEQQNMLSQMAISAPRGTNVKQILGGRGTVFESPPGAQQAPASIQPPPIGDIPFRELEHTRQAVRDIAYQHEVSKGYTPPNVRSGTAISLLKEVDDSAATIPLAHIERAQEIISNHILHIVRAHWDAPRQIKVISQENELERVSFVSGEDVGGQYAVQAGSAWPFTRAEKQGMVLQLHERQLLSPEETLKYVDMGSTAAGVRRDREIDYRHARRENQKFEAAQPNIDPNTGQIVWEPDPATILPADWHNHLAHIDTHNKVRKSPKYERWPVYKQLMFEAHIAGHMAALYAQMASQPPLAAQEGIQMAAMGMSPEGAAGADPAAPAGAEPPASAEQLE